MLAAIAVLMCLAGCGRVDPMPTIDENLAAVIDRVLDDACELHAEDPDLLPFEIGGHTDQEIIAHSSSLSRPMPDEIAQLYMNVRGFRQGLDCVWLWPLEETGWADPGDEMVLDWLRDEHPEWFAADYYVFGSGVFGDTLAYCPNPPGRTPGSILMLDHEGAGPESNPDQPCLIVFYGDSLGQWLQRWAKHRFREYGYYLGELDNLPPEEAEAFRKEHERLNPGVFESYGMQ